MNSYIALNTAWILLVEALAIWLITWIWVWIAPTGVLSVPTLSRRGGLAASLPGLILIRPEGFTESVLRHELEHQKQMKLYSPVGVAMFLLWYYFSGALRGRLRSGRWPDFWELWSMNPLEIEANKAMLKTDPLPKLLGRGLRKEKAQ
jgi:hypothetical protein